MATPGQWENFSGELDPSSIRGGPQIKTLPFQAVTEASCCEEAKEEEKDERKEKAGNLDHRLFQSDSANSRSK